MDTPSTQDDNGPTDQIDRPRKRQRVSNPENASPNGYNRFVGDLNPESVLASQSGDLGGQRHGPVGVVSHFPL